jgi:hypothetical protein
MSGLGARRARRRDLLVALAGSRPFAYGALLALQAKVVWGIWRFKDLSAGDTASYFIGASRWAESLQTDPVWSPLYLIFYGSLQWLFADAFAATIAHRLIVLAALDVLVLAVLRRLLPHGIAWALAAWFALLSINFDSLYEVHLFAALPALLAAAVAARVSGYRGRATTLGILVATTLLVRNEYAVATGLWLLVCLAVDGRRAWSGEPAGRRRPAAAYGLALALVGVVVAGVSWRSAYDRETNRRRLRHKHTLNVCQVYAFGYAQRRPEWTASPWTACQELMQRDFGAREPTLAEALRANPRALLEHAAWNARLVPAGLQLQLFGRVSGRDNPDYVPVRLESPAATLLSAAVVGLLAAGAILLWRERDRWWREWLRQRRQAWLLLGCLAVTSAGVMLMQRPRTSYLFPQTVTLLAMIGVAGAVLARRLWPRGDAAGALPVVAAVLVLAVPSYYGPGTPQAFGQRGQPLRRGVERLSPLRQELAGAERRLAAAQFPFELCAYVGHSRPCTGVALGQLTGVRPAGRSARSWIEEDGAEWLYLDELVAGDPVWRSLAQELEHAGGWRRWPPAAGGTQDWILLRRPPRS